METLILERDTPMEALFSFIGAHRRVRVEKKTGKAMIFPVIDPADYDNDTDYLKAIPGMMESVIASINAPVSEREEVPEELFNV
jgi:hypothetical protein